MTAFEWPPENPADPMQNAFVQDYLTAWAKANLPDGDARWDAFDGAVELIQGTYQAHTPGMPNADAASDNHAQFVADWLAAWADAYVPSYAWEMLTPSERAMSEDYRDHSLIEQVTDLLTDQINTNAREGS